ncbi:hypothetical protein FGO68_gene2777 [Halteria grandinella]|uniref:Glutamine amidotransferase domain-containing protein n=1 Tax=Halteria grandinella TaxID=5974 RepID=A0A8J8T8F2_HALGN|nr:hypothetical protein FGO68_gene2777 [Halteria grandinella]
MKRSKGILKRFETSSEEVAASYLWPSDSILSSIQLLNQQIIIYLEMVEPSKPHFDGEDDPYYKHCQIILYHQNQAQEVSYYLKEDGQPLNGTIIEREGSIMYTIARVILQLTAQYLPKENLEYMSPYSVRDNLYQNPLILKVIRALYEDDRVIIQISGDTWYVIYPLTIELPLDQVNLRLKAYSQPQLKLAKDALPQEFPIDDLKTRLTSLSNGTYHPKPYYGFIMEEDTQDWQFVYQGLFMGNFATDWTNKRWKVYSAFRCELPSEEDLKSIKALVFPGSARAVHDPSNAFVEVVSKFIRKVLADHSEIKLFGSCFGHQIFGHALGGRTEQMKGIPEVRQKIIGREYIKVTEAFYEMPYVKKYMEDKGFTKDTMPKIVLQQSHGDQVCILPPSATLLGYSDFCAIEMFGVGERLLSMQPHPDFNQGVGDELNAAEYLIPGIIRYDAFERNWLTNSIFWYKGEVLRETRNMMHAIIRNFLYA